MESVTDGQPAPPDRPEIIERPSGVAAQRWDSNDLMASMDMIPEPMLAEVLKQHTEDRLAEAEAIIEDYFQNDLEGWTRGYKAWNDRARKFTGRPTSEELRAAR